MKREKQFYKIICIVFFVVLWGFWLADVFTEDRIYSDWEKRMLAQRPQTNFSEVMDGTYGEKYEEWLTDQFPGRDWWVSVKTRCEILLGKKEIQGIYLGKDGYQFAESEATADWDKLEKQMTERFGADKVSRIHAPHAGAVLSEKLPANISFGAVEDAMYENLKAHADKYIYFKTDHHWTMLGAYYAYEAWAEGQGLTPMPLEQLKKQVLREEFLGTHYGRIHYAEETDALEFYDVGKDCEAVYDLGQADVHGLYQEQHLAGEDAYRYFLDGNHGLVEITTGQEGGHLAVIKDSFANCLIPYLTLHYEKITVIDPRFFRTDIGAWLSDKDVTQVLILAQDTTNVEYKNSAFESIFQR